MTGELSCNGMLLPPAFEMFKHHSFVLEKILKWQICPTLDSRLQASVHALYLFCRQTAFRAVSSSCGTAPNLF